MSGSNRKTVVTFDLWETLIVDEPERDDIRIQMRCEALHKAFATLGLQLPYDDVKRGYEESAPRLQEIWAHNEDVSTIEQIKLIIELASGKPAAMPTHPPSLKILEKAYVDSVFAFPPKLNEEAYPTLEHMRSEGYRIGLISNTGRSPGEALRKVLDGYGILRFFDATIFSNEVGYRKPDKRIFQEAASRLETNLENIVHIGDDPETDIWGAKEAGMRALLYEHKTADITEWQPNSLFVLSRQARHVPESEIRPDGRIGSLVEALNFVRTLE